MRNLSDKSELTENHGEGVLAEVEPLQPAGAGGLGQGLQHVVLILPVRHHGQLVLSAGEEVGQSHLDVLAGELVEGDILSVDHPGSDLVVPAAIAPKLVFNRALV